MKNISAWAIRHPVTPIVLFVVLFFLGTVKYIKLAALKYKNFM